jgi:hypothetical protein
MWQIIPLLGDDPETNNETTAVARQFAKPGLTEDFVCRVKARIFNNMLYVRYVRLAKSRAYS